jgi:hypothetical protein
MKKQQRRRMSQEDFASVRPYLWRYAHRHTLIDEGPSYVVIECSHYVDAIIHAYLRGRQDMAEATTANNERV